MNTRAGSHFGTSVARSAAAVKCSPANAASRRRDEGRAEYDECKCVACAGRAEVSPIGDHPGDEKGDPQQRWPEYSRCHGASRNGIHIASGTRDQGTVVPGLGYEKGDWKRRLERANGNGDWKRRMERARRRLIDVAPAPPQMTAVPCPQFGISCSHRRLQSLFPFGFSNRRIQSPFPFALSRLTTVQLNAADSELFANRLATDEIVAGSAPRVATGSSRGRAKEEWVASPLSTCNKPGGLQQAPGHWVASLTSANPSGR